MLAIEPIHHTPPDAIELNAGLNAVGDFELPALCSGQMHGFELPKLQRPRQAFPCQAWAEPNQTVARLHHRLAAQRLKAVVIGQAAGFSFVGPAQRKLSRLILLFIPWVSHSKRGLIVLERAGTQTLKSFTKLR